MNPPGTHKAEPIFGIGNASRSRFVSTADRVNAILEMSDNGRQAVAAFGLPGLVRHLTTGPFPARGAFAKKGSLSFYMAVGTEVVLASQSGPQKTIATLSTDSGPVWMDDSGTQLMINDGATAFIHTYATERTEIISAAGYQAGARGCTFLQGRFWVYTTQGSTAGRCYASAQYDGLSWNGLDFITPAARPTGIIGIDRWQDDLVILGQGSVEWWTGTPTPIAGALGFQPSANANTEVGGKSERGSAKVGQRFFFVGESQGSVGVYEIQGYSIVPVSTPLVSEELTKLSAGACICTGYSVNEHHLFQVTIPGDSKESSITWVYDVMTKQWCRRTSINLSYYRGLYAVSTSSAAYITDAFTGHLYRMDENVYTEDGQPMEFELSSIHILKEGDMLTINKIQVDMETGLGNPMPPGNDPHGLIQVSKDGGKTWPIERIVSLGKMGEYKWRAQGFRFGAARGFAVRFRITAPIPRRVTGAYLVMTPGYA